jgi:hypothetical protein
LLISVGAFGRNDVPDAAPRILHVALPARNQVHVAVEDRLTAHKTVVDPDIPAFDRRVFGFKNLFLRVNQQINRVTLFLSEPK